MTTYLIEFRFQSKKAKDYLKGMVYEINRTFRVSRKKHVPHITLVGPITTHNEKRLISDFSRICSETKLMKFKVNGFGTFDNNKIVFVNIDASDRLNEFRVNLLNTLRFYCNLPQTSKRTDKDKFGYHTTLAMHLDQREFDSIKKYIASKSEPDFSQVILRITLLKKGKILREYDFMQRRLFNRRLALNRYVFRNSLNLLKRFFEGTYDPNRDVKTDKEMSIKEPVFIRIWKKLKEIFK